MFWVYINLLRPSVFCGGKGNLMCFSSYKKGDKQKMIQQSGMNISNLIKFCELRAPCVSEFTNSKKYTLKFPRNGSGYSLQYRF